MTRADPAVVTTLNHELSAEGIRLSDEPSPEQWDACMWTKRSGEIAHSLFTIISVTFSISLYNRAQYNAHNT